MILTALYRLGVTVIGWLLGLMPSMNLPSLGEANEAVSDSRLWSYWAWGNHFAPLNLLLALLTLRFAVWAGLWAFGIVHWALTKLHIAGGTS